MWISRTILALVYAAAVCHALAIQTAAENANTQVTDTVNSAQLTQFLFGDGDQLISRRMGDILQQSGSQQSPQQQQQYSNSGINQDFLPFLQALASPVGTADPAYQQPPQQQQQVVKQNRQGYYDQGGHGGHVGQGYDGHVGQGYDGFTKHIKLGAPSVGIKFEPFKILKALLALIPRPKLNLNGKLFFGVELGKKAAIGKGHVAPAPYHHPY